MVGIIPKATKKAPAWHNLAFYIAGSLVLAVISGYAVLFYFEGNALNNLQAIEEEINQVVTKEERGAEVKVLMAEKKINDFSKLFQEHKKSSDFLVFLEQNSHPKVWFSKVTLSPQKAEAMVSGQAASFEVLDQQFFIFQQQELVQNVNLTNFLIGKDGQIGFSFDFRLDPKIFQFNNNEPR